MQQAAQPLPKLANADMQAVRSRMGDDADASELLAGCATIAEALHRLEQSDQLVAAARLMAHALPRREAVWWACMCALHTAPPNAPPHDAQTREVTETWVRKQTEDLRREAMASAERCNFASPEAWAAVGAFWSGDSMAPVGQPNVPPAPHLAGVAVAGAVVLASVRGDPSRQRQRLEQFLASAREIAAGGPGRLTPESS